MGGYSVTNSEFLSADGVVDIHICGGCKTQFHDVELFLIHKRESCSFLLNQQTKQPVLLKWDKLKLLQVEPQPPQSVTESLPTEHAQPQAIQNEAGEDVGPYLITPPLGHEYVQTVQKQQVPKPALLNHHVLVTSKGEMILVQDKSGVPNADQTYLQQHGENLLGMLQQQLLQNAQNIQNGQEQAVISNCTGVQEQQQVYQQEITQDNSAPRMQLDHNGSYSLVPSSQIPANLQLTVNPQQLNVAPAVSEASQDDLQNMTNQNQVLRQLLSNQNQAVIQRFQQQQQQQFSGSPLADLAQQAAAISGVDPEFQNLPIEIQSSEQGDGAEYSVHLRSLNQPSSDGSNIENVMQVQDAHLQDNTVSGTHQPDTTNVQSFEQDVLVSQPSLDSARQMLMSSIETSQRTQRYLADAPVKRKRIRPTNKYKCDFDENCTFTSAYLKDLERHMRTHTGEKPYSCEYCDKAFSRIDKLRLHVRGHKGDKPFKCELCEYRSVDRSSLRRHNVTHTRDRKHKCQVCPYACRTASQLTVHLRIHTGDCPFPCPFCPSKFKIKSDLRRHIRVHTGEKPYICRLCSTKFATNGNLASHMRVHHSDDKQIQCPQCDFSSSSKRSLQEHIKSHEPDNPDTTCPICDYQCANKAVLKNHLVTHKTEKEYACSYCNFSTKHKANLMIHIRRRHVNILSRKSSPAKEKQKGDTSSKIARIKIGNNYSRRFEKQFHCDICDESFVRKDSLNSHKRLHDEMAKSTLSTALTVLRLQQPVINVTTSQNVSSDATPSSSCQEEVVEGEISTTSAIGNISIIEKRGISNEPSDFAPVETRQAEQNDNPSEETPVQSEVYSEITSSENIQEQLNLTSLPAQIEPVSSASNNEGLREDLGMNETSDRQQTLSSDENIISRSDLSVQPTLEVSQTAGHLTDQYDEIEGSQPVTDVMVNLDGQSQPTINYESNSQSTDGGNTDSLNNVTVENINNQTTQVPVPAQMCQIPSIQLVQNISFPLLRLPNGQIIPTFGGQPMASPIFSGIRQSNPTALVSNPVQGTGSADFPLQPNIPLHLFSPNDAQNFYTGSRPVEPYGHFIDNTGQPIQSPIQLVLATSTPNPQTISQAASSQPHNSIQEVTSSTPDICTDSENQQQSEQTHMISVPVQLTEMTNQSTQEENSAQSTET